MPRSQTAGIALAIAAGIAFSLTAIFAKFALGDGGEPLGILAVRFSAATLLLLIIAALFAKRWPAPRIGLTMIAVGAVGQTGMALCFFNALSHASAGLVGLLLYLHPALIAVGELALGWERPRPVKWLALGAATIGCALTAGGGEGSAQGVLWALGAALCLTGYLLAAKRVAGHADATAATALYLSGATVVLVTLALFTGPSLPQTSVGWSAIVGLVLVSTVIGSLCLFAALPRLPASDVGTLMTIEPVLTIVWGVIFLAEQPSAVQLIGASLIVASVVLLARSVRQR